ncbi:MAG: hypothetical protein ACI9M9_000338 [Flavobacteriaceae bacterium]|jgi:hypothetical protein
MKKTILFFSLILCVFLGNAQVKNVSIDWRTNAYKNINIENNKSGTALRSKENISQSLRYDKDRLSFIGQWKDTGFADATSLSITNIKYGLLSSEDLAKIDRGLISIEPKFSIKSSRARDLIYTRISTSPVVIANGIPKKILSFTVNYKKELNRNTNSRIQITNSVLATGDWFKFRIDKTGIYRLDQRFLNDLGMNTDNIDPRSLKIYGHGGKPLPFNNSLNIQFDLPQNTIQVIGEEDGVFNAGDGILFYASGVAGLDEIGDNDTNLNPYSDEAFYYVTAEGGPGLRVQAMIEPTTAPSTTINQFNDYKFHEVDDFSPGLVGRRWYGNRFDIESEQSYEFDFPNLVSNSDPMKVVIKCAASSESGTSMALSVNGTSLDPLNFFALSGQRVLSSAAREVDIPASSSNGNITVDLAYNNRGNPSSVGYLDYISIDALRELRGVDGQLMFKYNKASALAGVGTYQISNASQFSQVWDVTNTEFISAKQNETGAESFSFNATLGEVRKYVAVNPNDYFEPTEISRSRVNNQNLKGSIFNDESGNFKDIDYLIITPPFLIQPALRLANHHKNYSGLNVKVVTLDKIYEEFSSGKQDISAIRNFVRYIYENASSPVNRIKYLGLFGDTSVDYKDRLNNNNNIVPTFHTLNSESTHFSYMSDDFFGMMDSNEGTMLDSDLLDIAVGRIVADEVGLANAMVDKIVNYTTQVSYGNWRNNYLLISDDVDKNGEQTLEVKLDALGDRISFEKPFVNVKKIHSDAFQQETSAGGNRYPKVNEAIKDQIELGAVIVNYFGHGGEDGLASEFIYTKDIANNLQNTNRYPCIVTVTCEFTKFDNPLRITAGELTYQNRNGGAVCLVTTTRSISISLGEDFNEALAEELFGFGIETPNPPAEGLRISKNNIGSDERRVVFYIGDPALRLAFPKRDIRLTTLNGVPISQATDTLKALSKVRIGGEVVDGSGNLITNYNGVLEAKIFDKNVQRQTLANDGSSNGFIMTFFTLGESLFSGKSTVSNGTFEFDFVMPRDTQIPVDQGRVSFYAQRNNLAEDQTGVSLDIKVGGLNENAPTDNQGPLIRLFMNDESFTSGGITNDSPILIAKLEDTNGMNTASGIGHDMVAILDGDESNPFVVNEYYQADVDDFSQGSLNYKLRDLEDGLHTLTFKAWDVYNNSSTEEIQFIVAGNDALEITRVLNYPNPFVSYTEFWFNHNRPYEPLEVQVQVFTVTGKVVWTKNQIIMTEGFLARDITWDGKDDFGDRIGKGVYVYKITVKSTLTNKRVEKFEKLVIL